MKKFISNDVMRQTFYGFLAVTAFLFAACNDSLSTPFVTVTGTGRVQVNVQTSAASARVQSARTVYPLIPHQNSLHYVYAFTRVGGNAEEQIKTPDTVGGSVFTLETGSWNLTVKAYLEAGHEKLVATGSTGSAFAIADGELNSTITVTLAPEKSEGEGTLTYTITYPAGAALTSLTWEPVVGTVAGVDYSLPAYTESGEKVTKPEAVGAGYYVFTALLENEDDETTAGKSEVVHIYQNLTTDVELVFIPSDFTASIPLPPMIPHASITNGGVEVPAGAEGSGDYQFNLTWLPTYTGPLDTDENIKALKKVFKKWKEYEVYMDARPYFPPIDQKRLTVWLKNYETGRWELMNHPSEGEMVILRYWPRELLDKTPPEPLTVASWYTASSNARRKADFLTVKEKLEAQMADLKASPFWNVSSMEGSVEKFLLREMYQDMLDFISTAGISEEDLYKDRDWEDTDRMSNGITVMNGAGSLYTLYFGPIPRKSDYVEKLPTSYYVFPVDDDPEMEEML
jgi:hypothetical protein